MHAPCIHRRTCHSQCTLVILQAVYEYVLRKYVRTCGYAAPEVVSTSGVRTARTIYIYIYLYWRFLWAQGLHGVSKHDIYILPSMCRGDPSLAGGYKREETVILISAIC
ncbi:hypothetical protein H105_03562 [Trichophyton soudanense CBS 452.61]|uniref:Uncharacterized protein n=1 Tax=Trichophyton soudanense CBS 452.61 TaxID=1215331 RepID=A0A022XVL2_TRISD|nr:hypothetical protein H105_03562 [Trichophyton soudanense CBS 452.61]EZG07238.1 hypothetical protein H106_03355 [Trichophyton rubrum CBS 735.88]